MTSLLHLLLSTLLFCLALPLLTAFPTVTLQQSPSDGGFNVSLNGAVWFTSGDLFFRASNSVYSPSDASLSLLSTAAPSTGRDSLGSYRLTSQTWAAKTNPPLRFETSIKSYTTLTSQPSPYSPPTIRALVFTQRYLTPCPAPNTTRDGVISAYPAFLLPASSPLGAYQWSGVFMFETRRGVPWSSATTLHSGIESGPYVVYNATARAIAMVAPLDAFMESAMALTPTTQGGGRQVSHGGMGALTAVPAGWSMSTMLYFDDVGVTEGVQRWGDAMRGVYGKSRATSANDLINSWLGYNTDRGATYYVWNEPPLTYEGTIYGVKAYADSLRLPYKYWLTDSRWYPQGRDGGMLTWDPKPSDFSQGFPAVTRATGLQLVAHTRYYSAATVYARENGGRYDFLVDRTAALPMDAGFWRDLFANRSDWGLTTLFQDWLSTHYEVGTGVTALTERVGLGEMWLRQMATGATTAGVTIQYCMPLSRHLLQAVALQAVTQIRVSEDGMPDDVYPQWQIGESAPLAFALGVIPFKDNFWTTERQCNNPYYGKACVEPNTVLESAVAVFSAGAVAPGDGIGQSNASLIMRTCNSEGRLLKPTRPMGSLDLWYAARTFNAQPVAWTLWTTYTELTGWRWWYLMAVDTPAMEVTADDLHLDLTPMAGEWVEWRATMGVDDYSTLRRYTGVTAVVATKLPAFTITHLAPVLGASGIVVLGEREKWVRASEQRMAYVDVGADAVSVVLAGEGGELVAMDWTVVTDSGVGEVKTQTCTVGANGQVVLRVATDGSATCSPVGWNREQEEVARGNVVQD